MHFLTSFKTEIAVAREIQPSPKRQVQSIIRFLDEYRYSYTILIVDSCVYFSRGTVSRMWPSSLPMM